ncbi:non-ribosomal peptide synthetase [Thalassomonas viridans]|uniref:Non-ribosomal peptide synthetase n=1 Tax=Thalassomonas viridans TaxID=137584 RepID=A0AAE9Z4U8_9GAMM|nr:non-ribosomal peptide synthetase [Thalassomonas viridans]WDE06110.1 non-ribosomal peptide synthetase [Thalassomonas viridans]
MTNQLQQLSKNIESIYPLAPVQQGMLFHTLIHPGTGMYLQQYQHTMVMDKLDVAAFEKAWQSVVDRHPLLRTAFVHETQERPLQVVMKFAKLPFEYLDFSQLEAAEQKAEIARILADERQAGLPFNRAPMMLIRLIKLSENRYHFIRSYHHILMDAWCFGIVMSDYLSFYRHYTKGTPLKLTEPARYEDYIAYLEQQDPQAQQDFWQQTLAGFSAPTSLGISQKGKFKDPQADLSRDVITRLTREQSDSLVQIAGDFKVTLNTVLQAAWAQTLAYYSNKQDVVFGVTVAGRSLALPGIESIVGLFINTLPLRCRPEPGQNLAQWLSALQQDNLAMRENEQVPLSQIQQWSEVKQQDLFDSIFVYENANMYKSLTEEALEFEVESAENRSNLNYPLTVTVLPAEEIQLELTYASADFDAADVEKMLAYFKSILLNLIALEQPQQANLTDIIPELAAPLCLAGKEIPAEKNACQYFAELAKQQPDADAVVSENRRLSYGELDARSNALAHYLKAEHKVGANTLVGLFVDRSIDMVVAMLAILKAGGAYVPLDPAFPVARLDYMIKDAGLGILLTQEHLHGHEVFKDHSGIALDAAEFEQVLNPYRNLPPLALNIGPDDLAYVIYTSGTTGNPKGVMVEHAQLSHFLLNIQERYQISAKDRVMQFSTINFDISVEECFGALCFGAALVLRDQACISDPGHFYDFCEQHGISVISLPTAFWHQLSVYQLEQLPASLRLIIVGGEALQSERVKSWFNRYQQVELINTYGPTEATVTACGYAINAENADSRDLPIGQANANTRLYVLNEQLQPVAPGTCGELYIGGAGVARGYLNQQELTRERFIQSPFTALPADRLYRSGDLVRCNADNQLEFIGRIDDQLKIRGFRVELGEIEQALSQCADINDAVVVAKAGENGDKQLVAYVVRTDNTVQEHDFITSLRQTLGRELPDYMAPSAFMLLDKLPLTPNGKVDRKALPKPELSSAQDQYLAPATATEKLLCQIWQQVLGIPRVGVRDNFFELGGHSLLVMQVMSRLQKAGLTMQAGQLFSTPSLADLAYELDNQAQAQTPVFTAPENLIPAGCEHITPEMLPLVSLSQQDINQIAASTAGGAANIQDIYPLGPLQEGILFTHMLSKSSDPYVTPTLFRMAGKKVATDFISALQFIIGRHDVLRTCVVWQDITTPVQVVLRELDLPVSWLEVNTGQDTGEFMQQLSQPEKQWLDLSKGHMIKVQVAEDDNSGDCFVLLQLHHIITDHVGLEVIQEELMAYLAGQSENLSPSLPYREFIAHSQYQAKHNNSESFFTNLLADVDEPTLPFNLKDVQGDGSRIVEASAAVPDEVAGQIRRLSALLKLSPASLFHSAWAMVVAACSGKNDIVFGTVVSGRLQGTSGAEKMPGVFINTLPLRLQLAGNSTLAFVQYTQQALQNLLPYEQVSLTLAQSCSGLPQGTPLFSAMLNYRHSALAEDGSRQVGKFNAGIELLSSQERTNYPFDLSVDDFGTGFALDVQVDNSVGAQRVLDYMQRALQVLTDTLLSAPEQEVTRLSVLPENEIQQQLFAWNNTAASYEKNKCLHERFEARAAETPAATALVFEDSSLTYAELNDKANQLARYLVEQRHIVPDTLVGICLERSFEMVISMLAVLKAGGGYVPLDPNYPASRLLHMQEDGQLGTVLTQSHLLPQTPFTGQQALKLDDEKLQQTLSSYPASNLAPEQLYLTPANAAYVIYTSGSTGKPKGVVVEHASVCNLIASQSEAYDFSRDETAVWFSTFTFDASIEVLWLTLHNGATLVIPTEEDIRDQASFKNLVENSGVTHLDVTPSYLPGLKGLESNRTIKRVISGGEMSLPQNLEVWQERLVNVYGPTEATITALICQDFSRQESEQCIGRPVANTSCYVLLPDNQLAPAGVAGELCIGGAGLARGYLNQPALTAEKFIANPFYNANIPGSSERLYKTGDLVRWLADGNLEFIDRIDHQVKIRGFRIELGEIEHALTKCDNVDGAIVLAKESDNGDKRLVAYVATNQAKSQEQEFISALRQNIGQHLSDYMIPSVFILLDKLPLTPNGKINRKALPEPELTQQQVSYVAPTTETEKILCQIWQEVLAVPQVGITDNFFELGGHSLLVMQVMSQLQQAGFSMEVRQLFQHPQLADLAREISSASQAKTPSFKAPDNMIPENTSAITPDMLPLIDLSVEEIEKVIAKVPGGAANIQDIYPLAPLQQGILFHHMMDPQNDPYVMPAYLKITGTDSFNRFIQGLNQVVARHDTLRTAVLWRDMPQPVQVVYRSAELPVNRISLPGDDNEDLLSRFKAYDEDQTLAVNIEQGPLLSLTVAHDSDSDEYLIRLLDHHVISDHVTMDIIQQELALIFADQQEQLPEPVQYREFVAFARHQEQQQDNAAREFFSKQLGDISETCAPFNLVNVQGDGDKIDEQEQTLAPDLSARLREQALRLKISPAALFHSAYAMVIAACSGQKDIVFGTVMSGRLQGVEGAASMMGMFINTLPLRISLAENSAQDLVRQTQEALRQLLPHEQVSLPFAQSCSGISGDAPLFTSILNYRHTRKGQEDGGHHALANLKFIDPIERTNYPFSVAVDDYGQDFLINVQVEPQIDAGRVLDYMITALTRLTDLLADNNPGFISQYPVLPAQEQQSLFALNATARDYPDDKCIYDLFEAQAAKTPDSTALIFEGQQLSYRQLEQRANQLARHLLASGAQPETLVALYMERSIEMLVAIWGVLKAGAAYVPLDPQLPASRIGAILSDSQPLAIISQQHLAGSLNGLTDVPVLAIDEESLAADLAALSPDRIERARVQSPLSCAYVIYTSGSTGLPKGVVCTHQGLVNQADAKQRQYPLTTQDKVLQKTPYSFDVSLQELIWPLVSGACLVIAKPEGHKAPKYLESVIKEHQITTLHFVPSMLSLMLAGSNWQECTSVKRVFCCGEAVSKELETSFFATGTRAELHNLYGPTEAAIDVSYWACGQDSSLHTVPIGHAMQNTQLLVLNESMQLVPFGVTGELHIGGAGLARGYLNREELTAKQFVDNPFPELATNRLYKTGDLVRYLPDGSLEYLGRSDHQVKIRGLRIELGEIEHQLKQLPEIASALVIAHTDQKGEQHLVAYFIGKSGSGNDAELILSLKQQLAQVLPDYMVPAIFIKQESWPLTVSGKINRNALPEPEFNASAEFKKAETPEQLALAEIWAELLALDAEEISISANFFELGGHSLLAMKLISRIEAEFNTSLSLQALFKSPTIATIAEQLTPTQEQDESLDFMDQLLNDFEV